MTFKLLAATASLVALCGCGPQPSSPPAPPKPPATPVAPVVAPVAMLDPAAVNVAAYDAVADQSKDRSAMVLRAQVLLDRSRFSPGVIDGRMGDNVRQALAAYQTARGLPSTGKLDTAVFDDLVQGDSGPALGRYVISAEDVTGPFVPIPESDLAAQAKLPAMGYATPEEALAEKFHMTEDLLRVLNPGADFSAAGSTIVVASVGSDEMAKGSVASVKVDKGERAVLAYDAAGKLVGFYPATIGSEDMPAPSGQLKVKGVAMHPTYTYDPSRLNYTPKGAPKGRAVVQAGPNNPVGAVWIALNKPTYGIHGAPHPEQIGKTFSHGCVRLTNWDVHELATAVKPGVDVAFQTGTATRG